MSTYGTWVAVAIAVTMAACSDDVLLRPGTSVPPPGGEVIRTEPASVAECPHGGSVVSWGFDDNGNRLLDDSEVIMRTTLCNDAPFEPPVVPPPPVIVRLVVEPPGAHCAEGGIAAHSGPDRNRNGRLDDDEVALTDYRCGEVLLTRLVAEPAGAHCLTGGIAILSGRDRDRDRELDDEEVEQTEYSCGRTLARDVTLRSKAEVAALARIEVIRGSLRISDPDAGPDGSFDEVSLPELQEVSGSLTISDVKLATRIRLPRLQRVGLGMEITDNALLATIEIPRLLRLDGSLEISRNPELLALTQLPDLETSRGDLIIADNAALSVIRSVTASGKVEIRGNSSLTELVVDSSAAAPLIDIADNGLRRLTISASGGVTLASVQVLDNPHLERVSVIADRLGTLLVRGNTVLDRVSLSTEQVTGDLSFADNARLDRLLLSSSLSPTLTIAGSLTVSDPISSVSISRLDIAGDLTLDGTQIRDLGGITRVGGTLRLWHNADLRAVLAGPVLGGGLEVVDNDVLVNLFLVRQDTINGDVVIAGNPRLLDLPSLPATRTVRGDVSIRDNPSLTNTDLVSVTTIEGTLEISNNAALQSRGLGLGKLVDVEQIRVRGNASLSQIALPVLSHAPQVVIEENAALRSVVLPALTEALSLTISHNSQLPSCQVEALFEQITAVLEEQVDNDDAAICVR